MIRFFSEDIHFPDICQPKVTGWIRNIISSHGKEPGDINVIFCSDLKLLEINRKFLQHDFFTDIITFDDSTGTYLRGDIYISLETVASNALQVGTSFINELHRVIIHGILHLCGFKDKTTDEKAHMRSLEDEALSTLNQ